MCTGEARFCGVHDDDARASRPRTSTTNENIEAVEKMILVIRRITVRVVANYAGIFFGSCQVIILDVLGMICAGAKIIKF